MKAINIALWLSLACETTVLAASSFRRDPKYRRDGPTVDPSQNDTAAVINDRYIIEFAEDTDVSAAVEALAEEDNISVLKVFDSDVFRGVAVDAPEVTLENIQNKTVVSTAWHSHKIFLGDPLVQAFDAGAPYEDYSIHHMTGVDKLHKAGLKGKGAKVGVIDTGIDYNHKALGQGFGNGFKVVGGYDFAGDGVWPTQGESKVPDEDPMDLGGHGTHVAGIIAGESDFFTGVAPEASLYAYKVFSVTAGTDEETLIEAMIRGYQDGMDILTISVGLLDGWADGPWALVASRMVEQGVLVVVAAGNDGGYGAYAANSGSSGANVLAVASVNADVVMLPSFKASISNNNSSSSTGQAADEEERWIAYAADFAFLWYPADIKDWPVYLFSAEPLDDEACSPLPADTPDLAQRLVIVRRGGCYFEDKQDNLAAFNATHVLFYGDDDDALTAPGSYYYYPAAAMITAKDAQALIKAVVDGEDVTANFDYRPDLHPVAVKNKVFAGLASPFTSVGPTNELTIKPDVAAPGGLVFSTFLEDGYATLSGTSMACPYVAGLAALYVGKHGGRASRPKTWAKKLAMRIIASGEAIRWDDGPAQGSVDEYDALASVIQVGTGLVNATKVVDFDTQLSFAKFALNDTAHFRRQHKVDITNNGKTDVTYTFSQQEFGGVATVNTDLESWGGMPRMAWAEDMWTNPLELAPGISFPKTPFTLRPGQTRTAQFDFELPPKDAADVDTFPIYSGKVLVTGSNGEQLGIPNMGLAADLKEDMPVMIETLPGADMIFSGPEYISINDKANFTFDLSLEKQDFPRMIFRLFYASREVRWDIFESGWTESKWSYPPQIGKRGHVGSVAVWDVDISAGAIRFDPEYEDPNKVTVLPVNDVSRTLIDRRGLDLWWLGRLANGTQIAPGRYAMRISALKPFGNKKVAGDWDVFETPEIEVLPLE